MKYLKNISFALLSIFVVTALACFIACVPSDDNMRKEVEKLNQELPTDLGDGMTMERIDFNDEGFVYIIACDEEFVNIDLIEETKDNVKAIMLENLNVMGRDDNEVKTLIDYCKKTSKSLSYDFIGKTSGKSVKITATSSEM